MTLCPGTTFGLFGNTAYTFNTSSAISKLVKIDFAFTSKLKLTGFLFTVILTVTDCASSKVVAICKLATFVPWWLSAIKIPFSSSFVIVTPAISGISRLPLVTSISSSLILITVNFLLATLPTLITSFSSIGSTLTSFTTSLFSTTNLITFSTFWLPYSIYALMVYSPTFSAFPLIVILPLASVSKLTLKSLAVTVLSSVGVTVVVTFN